MGPTDARSSRVPGDRPARGPRGSTRSRGGIRGPGTHRQRLQVGTSVRFPLVDDAAPRPNWRPAALRHPARRSATPGPRSPSPSKFEEVGSPRPAKRFARAKSRRDRKQRIQDRVDLPSPRLKAIAPGPPLAATRVRPAPRVGLRTRGSTPLPRSDPGLPRPPGAPVLSVRTHLVDVRGDQRWGSGAADDNDKVARRRKPDSMLLKQAQSTALKDT